MLAIKSKDDALTNLLMEIDGIDLNIQSRVRATPSAAAARGSCCLTCLRLVAARLHGADGGGGDGAP